MKKVLQTSLMALLAVGTIGCPIKSAEEARRDCEKFGKAPYQIMIIEHDNCLNKLDKLDKKSPEWNSGFDSCVLEYNSRMKQYDKVCNAITYTIKWSD